MKLVFRWARNLCIICFVVQAFSSCSSSRSTANNGEFSVDEAGVVLRSEGIFRPKRKIRVVLDAGHGGRDYGTHSSTTPRYHEKFLTLSTTLMVYEQLKKMGYKPVLTRNTDEFIALSDRAKLANSKHSDLFISIHYNSAPNAKAQGIEIYYYGQSSLNERQRRSKDLAGVVLQHVIHRTKARSRGVKSGNFAVVRQTDMPAILIEAGFLTNEEEMDKIRRASYLKRLSKGIAKGIDSYIAENLL